MNVAKRENCFAVDFDLQEGVFIKNPLEQNDILLQPLEVISPKQKTVVVNKTLHSFLFLLKSINAI